MEDGLRDKAVVQVSESAAAETESDDPARLGGTETAPKASGTIAAEPPESAATDPTSESPISNNEKDTAHAPLSKNQLKKRRRLEHKMEVKRRRKQQEREAKEARARAQGRDLELERQEQKARTGISKAKRDTRWTQRLAKSAGHFGVAIDCAFEDKMTPKEINSLALQLRYCYAINRRSDLPCHLTATSVTGATLGHLHKVSGFKEWKTRGFVVTKDSLDTVFADRLKDLVYLTSDSENTLDSLDNSKIYIIGGIVDRNRLKQAALKRAQSLKITTAKLPLDQYLAYLPSTPVLTCNHVMDILMHKRDGKDWQSALLSVLPPRKGATIAQDVRTEALQNQPK